MRRRARAILSLSMAAISWVLLSVALLIPTILESGVSPTLFAAGFVAGIQAGQSSIVQVAPRNVPNWALIVLGLNVGGILAGVGAGLVQEVPLTPILATVSGACLGVPLGASANTVLARRGGLAYQSFQVQRSVLLCLAMAIASSGLLGQTAVDFGLAAIVLSIASTLLSWAGARRARGLPDGVGYRGDSDDRRAFAYLWVIFGLIASLYYRNDTTWLRASVAASADFELWHLSLIGYSALQGFVGFLVVQRLFAHRDEVAKAVSERVEQYRIGVWLMWIVVSTAVLCVSCLLPIPLSVGLAAILSVVVGFASGLAHVGRLNWAPYLGGILGTTILVVILHSNLDPRLALPATNVIIGYVLFGALLTTNRRR